MFNSITDRLDRGPPKPEVAVHAVMRELLLDFFSALRENVAQEQRGDKRLPPKR